MKLENLVQNSEMCKGLKTVDKIIRKLTNGKNKLNI